ncbi:TetR/AcrR family transcriptional regulator [Clostridium sp. 'White wine YQ']|uniref:TetR/AcrR family transcriptional regulator n=1 Tax=Clostridium sp. 'White wine YQ' TaxID=3027474 RepID=UPI002365CF68|nr:TetR/AcrR family transcriptional regulator [Clostridium sp. 'White wine YQ']MDD7794256.1 WHG domain-containing protein [Clostridium sp. 'White wine YQ']
MQKRNLTKEKIIEVSFSLADEIGLSKVTFPKIAEKLGIKYPSLYNHFTNMDDLKTKMTIYLLKKFNITLMQKLIGRSGEDAIREFANSYRDFALKNKTAYWLFTNIPETRDEEVINLANETKNIVHQILSYYVKDDELQVHKSRILRSLLHGFVTLHSVGYLQGPVSIEESFKIMIDDFILSIQVNNINR